MVVLARVGVTVSVVVGNDCDASELAMSRRGLRE